MFCFSPFGEPLGFLLFTVLFVGLDNLLYQPMAHHITFVKFAKADASYMGKNTLGLNQACFKMPKI